MKRYRKSMKDRPPERVRRSEEGLRRFHSSLAAIFGFAFLIVWGLSANVQTVFQSTSAVPAANAGTLSFAFAIVGLLLLNMLLIGAETAVEAIRPGHVKLVRERDARRSERLQSLHDDRHRITAACTVAVQLVRLGIILCTFLIAPALLERLNGQFGWAVNHTNLVAATVMLLIPIALIHLVVGELIPKSYALVNPVRVATSLYSFAKAVSILFSIPAEMVTSIRNFFVRRFGSRTSEEAANLAEEEIKTLAEEAHETGEIEVSERELLHSVFEFTDTVAREVMTPRVDMDAVSIRSDPTEVVRVIQESGHSRIPLYEGTDDQIVGIIHAKDLFGAMLNGKAPNLRTLMRAALFVPENKNLHELLTEMRQNRSQMAVVQDEFGGTAGIVTIEDIVEELVGDIVDEYDVEEPEFIEAAGGWLVDGRTHLDDVNSVLHTQLESDEFDTIGGYVFGLFGRQPKLGEVIEADDLRFIVAESDGRRISRIKIEAVPEAALALADDED